MSKLIVRQADARDIDAIARLEEICFKDPWSREAVREEIEDNDLAMYMVAELEKQVIGYVGIWYIGDEGHITNVAVDPNYRKLHVGSAIINCLIEFSKNNDIKAFTLEVRVSNIAAKNLYKKIGFEEAGIRPHYYKDNEDAIIMWRMED